MKILKITNVPIFLLMFALSLKHQSGFIYPGLHWRCVKQISQEERKRSGKSPELDAGTKNRPARGHWVCSDGREVSRLPVLHADEVTLMLCLESNKISASFCTFRVRQPRQLCCTCASVVEIGCKTGNELTDCLKNNVTLIYLSVIHHAYAHMLGELFLWRQSLT